MTNLPHSQRGTVTPALSAQSIGKRFGPISANDDVSLTLHYGKIHALLGENGAGKSTLVSILYGLLQPDAGTVSIDGHPVTISRPADALKQGIGLVEQHFSTIPAFTVLENLQLGREVCRGPWLDTQKAEKEIRAMHDEYGFELPLHHRVGELPVGMRQQVEIARILYRRARIMLFDEPTAALVSNEIDRFLETLQTLRKRGIAILLITHRLPEVLRVADEVTVLRQGRTVLHEPLSQTTPEAISTAIVGERLPEERYELPEPHEPVFEAKQISFTSKKSHKTPIQDLSLDVRKNEILGVAGVAGNGQEELIDLILGLQTPVKGQLILNGEDVTACGIAERKKHGLAYIPQDRAGQAMLADHSIVENYMLNQAAMPSNNRPWLPRREIEERVNRLIHDYSIQTPSIHTRAQKLSGGHQQRMVISRELFLSPRLAVAHNPTRGLDLRASRFVHETIIQQCREGAGVILFSSEWTELFLLCRRIAVIYAGRIVDIRNASDWSAPDLGHAMVGGAG